MPFPTSPVNGDRYADSDGITHEYTSAKNKWKIVISNSAKVTIGTAFPVSPTSGEFFYRSDLQTLYLFKSTVWVDTTASAGSENRGVKNSVLNSRFESAQEGAGSNRGTSVDDLFFLDIWRLQRNPNGGTMPSMRWDQQPFTLGQTVVANNPRYYLEFNYSTTGTTGGGFEGDGYSQTIRHVERYSGKTVTLSFCARTTISGGHDISTNLTQVFGGGGSASVYTFCGRATLTTAWERFEYTFDMPSISGKVIGDETDSTYLEFHNWMGTSIASIIGDSGGAITLGNTGLIQYADVQLEESPFATEFEIRPLHQHLVEIEPFLEVINPLLDGQLITRGHADSTTTGEFSFVYRTKKIITPSVSFVSGASAYKQRHGNTSTVLNAIGAGGITLESFRIDATRNGGSHGLSDALALQFSGTSGQIVISGRY